MFAGPDHVHGSRASAGMTERMQARDKCTNRTGSFPDTDLSLRGCLCLSQLLCGYKCKDHSKDYELCGASH